jgi:hypothetical protein
MFPGRTAENLGVWIMTELKSTTMTDGQPEYEHWDGFHAEIGLSINEDCKMVTSNDGSFIELDTSWGNYEAYLRMTPGAAMILIQALSDEVVEFCRARTAHAEPEPEPVSPAARAVATMSGNH